MFFLLHTFIIMCEEPSWGDGSQEIDFNMYIYRCHTAWKIFSYIIMWLGIQKNNDLSFVIVKRLV